MSETALLYSLFGLGLTVLCLFSFVLLFGAPFLPTKRQRVQEALDLLDLKPGQTLLELGSGDGRLLRAAAQRGITAIGYELNPLLVLWSRLICYRQRARVTIQLANYWNQPLPPADGIYVFLLQPYMAKLDAKISHECLRPLRLVSFAFRITSRPADREQQGLFLYAYLPRER